MNLNYLIRESLHSLSVNPLRSGLSILGVVFGVASVVAMLAIGLGAEHEVQRLLDALGARNIHVTANELDSNEWNRVLTQTVGLSERDKMALRALYEDDASIPDMAEIATWRAGDANHPLPGPRLSIYGATVNVRDLLGAQLAAGRMFTDRESLVAAPVAILGAKLARAWFGDDPRAALGAPVRFDRTWFHVIGVLQASADANETPSTDAERGDAQEAHADASAPEAKASAMPGGGGDSGLKLLALGDAALVPLKSGISRLGPLGQLAPLSRIVLRLPESADASIERQRIVTLLDRLHRGAKTVSVVAADEVIEQKRATSRLFSYFLLTIALISLVVGGIGIANVMLATMVERIREVGLRRAIGAKRRDILAQFLAEALAICLVGGIVGGFAGMGVSSLIGLITGWSVAFPWWGLGVALLIATLVGMAAGIYPALLASKISPIEALQGRA